MSATVLLPLATAAIGLVAGVGAVALTQWRSDRREDVRWERERDDRQEQWQREDSQRWLQHRQQAYAQFAAALYEWDSVLGSAVARRALLIAMDEPAEVDTDALDAASSAAREALPPVQFMAPQPVRSLAESAVSDREVFRILSLEPAEPDSSSTPDGMDAGIRRLTEEASSLHQAMRADLGLGGEDEPGAPVLPGSGT